MIDLLRCDDRLIHGQCIVRVINDGNIGRIILVDDFTAGTPVMVNIYKMAVPPTVKIDIVSTADGAAVIEQYAEQKESVLVLVKDPCVALKLLKATDKLPRELNIGPMSNRNNTKKATFYSYLLPEEAAACRELTEMGISVFFRQVPDAEQIEWTEFKM